jgi:hypothetical protein
LPTNSFSAMPSSSLLSGMPLFGGSPLMAMGGRGAAAPRTRPIHGRKKGYGSATTLI